MLSTRTKNHGNYFHEMTDDEHREMLEALKKVRGFVVLSGYPNALYDTLGWKRVERVVLADGARKRIECLWLNPQCEREAPELFSA